MYFDFSYIFYHPYLYTKHKKLINDLTTPYPQSLMHS